ncbi:MAG: hypothetical protein ACLRWQ_20860 [Flavonifractor plautii]
MYGVHASTDSPLIVESTAVVPVLSNNEVTIDGIAPYMVVDST